MFRAFGLILFFLYLPSFFAQDIPIGDWRGHLPYNDIISLSQTDNLIYCATNSAVFTYDVYTGEIDRLDLVNGLSDIGVSKIATINYNKKVIVAYKNGNIDIIDQDKNITNLAYIKNSNVNGSKSINNIHVEGKFVYLSTGFGIVVLDAEKLEVKDTYLIGDLGSYVNVNGITVDTTYIYASTNQGVYRANKNDPNLVDYSVWDTIPEFGTNKYDDIVTLNNTTYVIKDKGSSPDSIYHNQLTTWQPIPSTEGFSYGLNVVNNQYLAILWEWGIFLYDNNLQRISELYISSPSSMIFKNNFFWIGNLKQGLLKVNTSSNFIEETVLPNSPFTANIFSLDFLDGNLWYASGGYASSSLVPSFITTHLVNYYNENGWNTLGEKIKNNSNNDASDAVCIAINPSNTSNVYFGTWNDGLFEVNNGQITNIYTAQNSVLDSTFFGTTKVAAIAFDDDNNLWVSSSSFKKQIDVITADNNWHSFTLTNVPSNVSITKLVIGKSNNFKWLSTHNTAQIIVFDDNSTLSDKNDDRVKIISEIPGTSIYSMVEDKDGELWIGTDEGIAVIYNTSEVFDQNVQAEQILIQQDGQTQILLETNSISAIAIDGANRKWIGTQNSGVYLMSQDGTEEIEHFTVENSPLFSNNILDIEINPQTGEVYFATEKGLISYKGTATEPDSDFNNIFVYPNPVKPDYEGKIAIRGLVKDTDVRITDISGNIVFQTTSFGGQAIWNGNDMNGNRVQSGVYMVFNGSQDGSKKAAAKILFLH